jgi:hypothetical protein
VKAGARIFQARWVDDPMKCKSRYVIKEYANQKDLSVFAAASDFATSRLVDYKAVRCGYPTFVFDVTSAYTHADEDEQVFLEPPEEEKAIHGDCLWESVKVIYGRRKGARSWQDHFVSVVQSPEAVEAGFTVKVHEKCPTMFYLVEADGLFELHVDDGHGTGRPDVIRKFLEYISQKIELKWVDRLKEGMSYEYLKTIKYRTNEGIWSIPSEKYIDSALERFGMTGCNPSSSPKVSKAEEPGDQSPVTEETASGFRSSVLTLLYMANERSDIQSTVRFLCTRLKEPVQGDVRRLKKLLRYMQGTRNVGTLFRADTSDEKVLKVFSDADWATDGRSRKSTSGAVIMASGCRLHAHSRGQDVVALSSCEAELYASSEAIKEAVLLKEMLLFCGMGEYSLELALDASSTRQLLYRKDEAFGRPSLVAPGLGSPWRSDHEEDRPGSQLGGRSHASADLQGVGGLHGGRGNGRHDRGGAQEGDEQAEWRISSCGQVGRPSCCWVGRIAVGTSRGCSVHGGSRPKRNNTRDDIVEFHRCAFVVSRIVCSLRDGDDHQDSGRRPRDAEFSRSRGQDDGRARAYDL